MHLNNEQSIGMGSARKVSPYWSQETMTYSSSNCFSFGLWLGTIGDFSSEQMLHAHWHY